MTNNILYNISNIIIFKNLYSYLRNLPANIEKNKLNNIINLYYPNDNINYISNIINNKGDLFILLEKEGYNTERFIYAIKNNGEKYFINEDNYYKKLFKEEGSSNRYPLLTFLNIDDKDYLISFSQDDSLELYDFQNNKIYYTFNLYITKTNSVIRKNIFTSLNYYNNSNYILNGFIDKKAPYKLTIQKIYFEHFQISRYNIFLINNTNSVLGFRN